MCRYEATRLSPPFTADVAAFMPFLKSMISVRPAGGGVAHRGAGVRASCARLARGCIEVSIGVDRETAS